MIYVPVYDIASDGLGLRFPLIGLGLILAGAVLRWGFKKTALFSYPLMVVGVGVVLVAGALPLWDHRRVTRAVAQGDARQVEGLIRDWRLTRTRGTRVGTSQKFARTYFERFSVGAVDFVIEWDSLEAGFKNRGSIEGAPTVRLANGLPARIAYLHVGHPDRPPRIVHLELAPDDWRTSATAAERAAFARELTQYTATSAPAGLAGVPSPSRVTDGTGLLSAEQKAQLESRLAQFEQVSGHRLLVGMVPSLGDGDITGHASAIASDPGPDGGILLLVAPDEQRARIVVGRGLQGRLPDTTASRIIEQEILPLFRRGDVLPGIEAGTGAIMGTIMSAPTP